jgi:hypothetical protein
MSPFPLADAAIYAEHTLADLWPRFPPAVLPVQGTVGLHSVNYALRGQRDSAARQRPAIPSLLRCSNRKSYQTGSVMNDITIDCTIVGAHVSDFSDDARDMIELRLLVELSAVRELADRGLSDLELAVAERLADATMQAARRGDVARYQRADVDFHMCLLELAGDPAVAQIGRHLLAASPAPGAADCAGLMTDGAGEHCELITMLAGGMVGAADDLIRKHVARPWAGPPADCFGHLTGPVR